MSSESAVLRLSELRGKPGFCAAAEFLAFLASIFTKMLCAGQKTSSLIRHGLQIFTSKHLDRLDPMGFVIEDKGITAAPGGVSGPDEEHGRDSPCNADVSACGLLASKQHHDQLHNSEQDVA